MAENFSGIKHKNQRVGVFIDVQNLYYSARHLHHSKVNFGEVLKAAVGDRQLIRAIAYVVRATGEEDTFFEALNQRGLETKERVVQEFKDGSKKADWDVGIVVDAIRISEILDVVVLVSGDGDFVEMVEYLQHHGRQVEAMAFKGSASQKLIEAVDDFTDLGAEKESFLIKYTNRGSTRALDEAGVDVKTEVKVAVKPQAGSPAPSVKPHVPATPSPRPPAKPFHKKPHGHDQSRKDRAKKNGRGDGKANKFFGPGA